eukprot:1332560-Amorphochlora_amoeboformis.AAC.2
MFNTQIRAYDKGMVPGVLTGKYANLGLYWYRDHTKKDTFKISPKNLLKLKIFALHPPSNSSSSPPSPSNSSSSPPSLLRFRPPEGLRLNQRPWNRSIRCLLVASESLAPLRRKSRNTETYTRLNRERGGERQREQRMGENEEEKGEVMKTREGGREG